MSQGTANSFGVHELLQHRMKLWPVTVAPIEGDPTCSGVLVVQPGRELLSSFFRGRAEKHPIAFRTTADIGMVDDSMAWELSHLFGRFSVRGLPGALTGFLPTAGQPPRTSIVRRLRTAKKKELVVAHQ